MTCRSVFGRASGRSTSRRALKAFSSPPRRLFGWHMATISIRSAREDNQYYAILKDERYPTLDWPTGKTIRVCSSSSLFGPYSEPGPPVSPGFREAPTLIPSPNGEAWYLYYEQYPGVSYGLSVSDSLAGKWFQASVSTDYRDWDKNQTPAGKFAMGACCRLRLDEHDALIETFGVETTEEGRGLAPTTTSKPTEQKPRDES